MGIIVKVYIENNDEEIDIVTLNSDDRTSSSVTIKANFIKEYLKRGRNDDLFGTKDERIVSKNGNNKICASMDDEIGHKKRLPEGSLILSSAEDLDPTESCINSDVNQSKNKTCSRSVVSEKKNAITANNVLQQNIKSIENVDSNENTDISQYSVSNNQLGDCENGSDGRNPTNVVDITTDSNLIETQQNRILATDDSSTLTNVSEQLSNCDVISEDVDMPMNITIGPSENLNVETADCSTPNRIDKIQSVIPSDSIANTHAEAVTHDDKADCDNDSANELEPSHDVGLKNNGDSESRNEENSPTCVTELQTEYGAENVIESLKHVSYDVDDFLNFVNNTPTHNNHQRLSTIPLFLNDFSSSPSIYLDESNEGEGELEEYFVVEKIAASRFNEETKVLEFLLKAQKCIPRKDPWSPIRSNISDLMITTPKCLYIQCPRGFRSYKRRKLNEKFDQYIQFVDLERGLLYDVPSETIPSCPSVVDITTNEFSSVNAADVVIDPQKSLNDACLIEPSGDDSKNNTPVKLFKSSENFNSMSDIGLPSAHFVINDIVPGLGDQVVDFLETKDPSATSVTASTDDANQCEKSCKIPPASPNSVIKNQNDLKHFQCPNCAYRTVSANALSKHLKRHSKNLFTCELCQKRYLSVGGLKNHQRTHRNGQLPNTSTISIDLCDSSQSDSNLCAESEPKSANEHKSPATPTFISVAPHTSMHLNGALRLTADASAEEGISLGSCDRKCKSSEGSLVRCKKSRGRPKRPKIETKEENAADDDVQIVGDSGDHRKMEEAARSSLGDRRAAVGAYSTAALSCIVAPEIGVKSSAGYHQLPECLVERADGVETNVDNNNDHEKQTEPELVAGLLACEQYDPKKCEGIRCDVCQCPFGTHADLLRHKRMAHKYPIVLLERLPY